MNNSRSVRFRECLNRAWNEVQNLKIPLTCLFLFNGAGCFCIGSALHWYDIFLSCFPPLSFFFFFLRGCVCPCWFDCTFSSLFFQFSFLWIFNLSFFLFFLKIYLYVVFYLSSLFYKKLIIKNKLRMEEDEDGFWTWALISTWRIIEAN